MADDETQKTSRNKFAGAVIGVALGCTVPAIAGDFFNKIGDLTEAFRVKPSRVATLHNPVNQITTEFGCMAVYEEFATGNENFPYKAAVKSADGKVAWFTIPKSEVNKSYHPPAL